MSELGPTMLREFQELWPWHLIHYPCAQRLSLGTLFQNASAAGLFGLQ